MPTAPSAPTIEAPPKVTDETRFTVRWLPPHKVIVHNNEHNTFEDVIRILMKAVPGLDKMEAIGYTYEIHLSGAAVVFRGDVEEAEACARTIRSIGLKVTVEPDE